MIEYRNPFNVYNQIQDLKIPEFDSTYTLIRTITELVEENKYETFEDLNIIHTDSTKNIKRWYFKDDIPVQTNYFLIDSNYLISTSKVSNMLDSTFILYNSYGLPISRTELRYIKDSLSQVYQYTYYYSNQKLTEISYIENSNDTLTLNKFYYDELDRLKLNSRYGVNGKVYKRDSIIYKGKFDSPDEVITIDSFNQITHRILTPNSKYTEENHHIFKIYKKPSKRFRPIVLTVVHEVSEKNSKGEYSVSRKRYKDESFFAEEIKYYDSNNRIIKEGWRKNLDDPFTIQKSYEYTIKYNVR